MKRLYSGFLLLILICTAALLWHVLHPPAPPPPAPLAPAPELPDGLSNRKENFLTPLLDNLLAENRAILSDRARIDSIREQMSQNKVIDRSDFDFLKNVAAYYEMAPNQRSNPRFFDDLLARVDIVPVSLALAQAALESGWGQSGSARHDHNYFGMTCNTPQCSGPPSNSAADAPDLRFRRFGNSQASIRHYLHTLNTHSAYSDFRARRAVLRLQDKEPEGLALADGLKNYSVMGDAYVRDIKGIIRFNHLDILD